MGFGKQAIGRLLHRWSLRRWTRLARAAETADLDKLHQQRLMASQLMTRLSELNFVANSRLALPRVGTNAFVRPGGTLWSWRPRAWRGPLPEMGIAAVGNRASLGDHLTVFHDCDISELTLRQIRNTRTSDMAPYGLRLDVFRFDGSFLSLVLDLPAEAIDGLLKRHIIRLTLNVELEQPLEIFARLNVRHGPNTEQMVQEIRNADGEMVVEFDLAYSDINERRIEAAWLDLIFEGAEMNQITLRDVTLCRYPRAEL
ncbi:hypothetical protein SAMN05428995_10754 [Loktanella sp. DSM 29012]|uniref:DUF6478 family protein n=1 Tax=Loktanella gaetbuli TaxID=2881335 RepID=A0ABS8BT08_9RHOB|nr:MULTISPECIES: DUF6478 family protein [Loktanella]MCB5198836.1 DUF6478 family protein [Loktanella gaetbuli]SEQ73736.1 hypothetical protein SAMN05428995_10754 [Loktanella sp. DSM 29012]